MADTLAEIVNTTVTAANLSTGEHTLLTTDSNTSHVIKDVYTSTPLTNLDLDLNGFTVADFTKNASGSLIVPPSSTLKLKSSQFPLDYQDERYNYIISGQTGLDSEVTANIGTVANLSFADSFGQPATIGIDYAYYVVGDYLYGAYSDWNSVQRLYKIALSNITSTWSLVTGTNISYSGNWVYDGRYFIALVSGSPEKVRRIDTQNNDTVTDINLPVNFALSSYPRNFYVTGTNFIMFCSSSGGNPKLINYLTGGVIELAVNSNWSPSKDQNYFKIFSSYDSENDTLYVGAFAGSANSMFLDTFSGLSEHLNTSSAITLTSQSNLGASFNTTYIDSNKAVQTTLATRGKYLYTYEKNSPYNKVIRFDLSAGSVDDIRNSYELYKTLATDASLSSNIVLGTIAFVAPSTAEISARSYDLSSYQADCMVLGVTVS